MTKRYDIDEKYQVLIGLEQDNPMHEFIKMFILAEIMDPDKTKKLVGKFNKKLGKKVPLRVSCKVIRYFMDKLEIDSFTNTGNTKWNWCSD